MLMPALCARFRSGLALILKRHLQHSSTATRCRLRLLHFQQEQTSQITQPLILKRGIRILPSQKKDGKWKPQYAWDGVPSSFEIIYESKLKNWIGGYYASLAALGVFSCLALTYAVPKQWEVLRNHDVFPYIVMLGLLSLSTGFVGFYASKFIIRIYHQPNSREFIAVYYSIIGRLRTMKYTVKNIDFKSVKDDFHIGAVIKIKGKSCHLSATDFVSSTYYNIHLGTEIYSDRHKSHVSGTKF